MRRNLAKICLSFLLAVSVFELAHAYTIGKISKVLQPTRIYAVDERGRTVQKITDIPGAYDKIGKTVEAKVPASLLAEARIWIQGRRIENVGATVVLTKSVPDATAEKIARDVAVAVINLLMKEGHHPMENFTGVAIFMRFQKKGVTGTMSEYVIGNAFYSSASDQIEWKAK